MGSSTAHGYPYPVGTDRVTDGDNAIQALADKVESRLHGGVWAAGVTFANVPAGGNVGVALTFPVGLFTAAPHIAATAITSTPIYHHAGSAGPSASGATIYMGNTYTGVVASITAHVIAHQIA